MRTPQQPASVPRPSIETALRLAMNDIPPEFAEIVNREFWNLLKPASVSPQAPTASAGTPATATAPLSEGVGQGGTAAEADTEYCWLIETSEGSCIDWHGPPGYFTGFEPPPKTPQWIGDPWEAKRYAVYEEAKMDSDKLRASSNRCRPVEHGFDRSAAPRPDAGEGLEADDEKYQGHGVTARDLRRYLEPDAPDVIGATAIPAPRLFEAVLAIADHIAMDTTEEAQQEAAVLRQAARALGRGEGKS